MIVCPEAEVNIRTRLQYNQTSEHDYSTIKHPNTITVQSNIRTRLQYNQTSEHDYSTIKHPNTITVQSNIRTRLQYNQTSEHDYSTIKHPNTITVQSNTRTRLQYNQTSEHDYSTIKHPNTITVQSNIRTRLQYNQIHLLAVHQYSPWEASCQNTEKLIKQLPPSEKLAKLAKNYTSNPYDMVHVPAKFLRNTVLNACSSDSAKLKCNGLTEWQIDEGRFNIPHPWPSFILAWPRSLRSLWPCVEFEV